MKARVMKFNSSDEFRAYVESGHSEAIGYSPGGAAARLGVSRQRVYEMIEQGHLRAWFVYDCEVGPCLDVPGNKASFVYISADDVNAYLQAPKSRGGRPPKVAA
jgi:hypothetical protein